MGDDKAKQRIEKKMPHFQSFNSILIRWARKSPENESQLKNQPNVRAEALRHSDYGGTLATILYNHELLLYSSKKIIEFSHTHSHRTGMNLWHSCATSNEHLHV